MIQLNDIAVSLGGKLLFHSVNLNLEYGRRYGITGGNGSGKTTFLKLLAGQEEPLAGTVDRPKNARIGWLRQQLNSYQHETVVDVVLAAKPDLLHAFHEKDRLLTKKDLTENDCYQIAELEETIAQENGYATKAHAHYLLSGLNISESMHEKTMSCLSGGYQIRVLLAQALFEDADVLLLDEPTNYLDIVSVAWLENFLKNHFNGLLVYVSHDRGFTNRLATDILDIDYCEITHYPGNYDNFLKQKELQEQQREHEHKHGQKKIAELNEFIERFKAKASKAKQAKAKMKQVERIQASLPDLKESTRRYPAFNFKTQRHSGKEVLTVNNLAKSFDGSVISNGLNFKLGRGDKAAILGPNGIGKSTMLKMLMEEVEPDSGDFEWGYQAHVAYCSQNHQELAHVRQSVLEWLEEQSSATSKEVRQTLGQVLFTQDDVHKSVADLSGGESTRLSLARTMLRQANVLVLDEPTNHLDMEAIESLTKALQEYSGTLLFVSHDSHFVTAIANRILALTPNGLNDFGGSYNEYLNRFGIQNLQQS